MSVLTLGTEQVPDLPVTEGDSVAVLGRDVLGRFDWIWHGPGNELLLLTRR